MQIESISYEEKPIKKFIEWSALKLQVQKNLRDHFDNVIAVVIDKMRRWGYLTDNDNSNKTYLVSHYNRVNFLITVLPRLKDLINKIIKSQ